MNVNIGESAPGTADPASAADLLQQRLAAALAGPGVTIPLRTDRAAPVPLTPSQARLWFLAQLAPDSSAYHVRLVLRLHGPLDSGAMVGAVRDLAQRHEVLRCRIVQSEGEPVALVDSADSVPVTTHDLPPHGLEALLAQETERAFTLESEPPMRAALFRNGDSAVLAMTFHHIAVDGWSSDLILDEVAALYAARIGLADAPPPAPQYTDFAAWSAGSDQDSSEETDWWVQRLTGLAPTLELPTDRSRTEVAAAAGGQVPVAITGILTDRVREAAARTGCTPFMVFLAAWQALLARMCGTTDIPVGVPESGRHHSGTEDMVGCFVNMVVLRTDLAGDPTGNELLSRVRNVALDAFAHAEVPFERVVQRLHPDRTPAAIPIVQATLNLLRPGGEEPDFPGLELEPMGQSIPEAKSDLGLTLFHEADSFTGTLAYRSDVFDQATVSRIATWYTALLSGMLADLDQPVGAVALEEGNGPALAGALRESEPETLHSLVEGWADRIPGTVAVVAPEGHLTYGELDQRANRIAQWLLSRGVRPEEPVAVLAERGLDLAIALLGVLKAGAAFVPLEPSHPDHRLSKALAAADAKVVLSQGDLAARLEAPQQAVIDALAVDDALSAARPDVAVRPEHLAYIIFTSGSTGVPKGVAVEHRSIAHYLHSALEIVDGHGRSFALLSTAAADLGYLALFGALAGGGSLHMVDRETATDPWALAAYFAAHPVDIVKMVPSHVELLAASGDLAAVLPRRTLVLAGEACPWQLADRITAARPDLSVYNHYGPTETTVSVLGYNLTGAQDRAGRRGASAPLGKPFPNVVCYVVDTDGRPLPATLPGELIIAGPGVSRGYLNNPEATARSFRMDPGSGALRCYRTGDRVRLTSDGLIEFLGRLDDQIKVRGYRVELGEVAAACRALPGVRDAVVLAVGEAHRRRVTAWLVPDGVEAPDTAALRTALRGALPDHMVPTSLTCIPSIPLTANGKVDRAALPEPGAEDRADRYRPSTPTELRVAAVWQEILELADSAIDADEDFFALGGDSFAAVRAARAIDPALRVIDLFTHPTVRELAGYLEQVGIGPGRLLHRLNAPKVSTATVICLPYGGASASVFQPLAQELPDDLTLYAVELPGHDPARPNEPMLTLPELVDRLAEEIVETVHGPIAVYGHCVGSAAAVALSRRLEAEGCSILGTVVGGSLPSARIPGRASDWVNRVLPLERWASNRLYRDILRATGGIPEDLDEAASETLLRGMRHDAAQARMWFTRQLVESPAPMAAPILCVIGDRDRSTELYQERYAEWDAFAQRVELATIPRAGHYFLRHQASALAGLITGRISGWAKGRLPSAAPAASVRPTGLRPFYAVAAGQFVSMFGSSLSMFALSVWAYQRSGRVLDLALVTMLATLPTVLLTPVGGALADRMDRRRIMLIADTVSGLTIAVLALLLSGGWLNLPSVCLVVATTAVATAFHRPAYLAATAQLVPKPYLPQANSLIQLGLGMATVLGPLTGGALVALVGLSGVVAVGVCSFAAGVGTLLAVRFPNRLFHRQEEPFLKSIAGGWRFIVRRRPLLLMVGWAAVLNCFASIVLVAIPPLVLSFADESALGLVTGIGGVGAAIGGIIMLPWGGTRRRAIGMIGAAVGVGAGTVLMGVHASVPLVATGLAVRMGSLAVLNAHWLSIIQVKVGPELQGRVLGTNLMLAQATQPIGFFAAGPLADGLFTPAVRTHTWLGNLVGGAGDRGMALLMVVCGLIIVAWGAIGLWYRPLRRLEDGLPDPTPDPEIAEGLDVLQELADRRFARIA